MSTALLSDVLLVSALLGYGLLLLWFLAWMLARDAIHALHMRWFRFERATFDALTYGLLGLCKILVLVFFLVPWLALQLAGGAA